MLSHYKIVQRKQDVGMRISSLYRQQQLAIGILDVGDAETLKSCLDWYLGNMNCCLHAVTLQERFDSENLGELYPDVTFICFKSLCSIGEQINAVADECYASFFLIVRSDTQIIGFDGATLISQMGDKRHPACITPIMLNESMEILPSLRSPYIRGKELDPQSFVPSLEEGKLNSNLYPLMGLGLYDRALFQRHRGFDEEILGEHYQMMDYGIRVNLFGYSIFTSRDFAIRFFSKFSIIEDRSPCEGMNRCYTRALSIHRIAGKNVVEKWKPYVDKQLLKDEVKNKQAILQKVDFFTLMKEWHNEET